MFGCVQYVQFSLSTVSIADRCVHIRSGTSWDADGTLANGCAPVSRRPDGGDPVKLPIGWRGYATSPCRSTGRASLASRASVSALDADFGSAGCLPASFRRRRVRRRLLRVTCPVAAASMADTCRLHGPAGTPSQRLAEAVVAAVPLREAMWRTLIRSAAPSATTAASSAPSLYQRALRAAEIAPAAATRALPDQLRR